TYTPFPATRLHLDFDTGRFDGTDSAPAYVLSAPNDSRFALRNVQAATNVGLVLSNVPRPYRALWATRGLEPDGWTQPGQPAKLRVTANPDSPPGVFGIKALLDPPPGAKQPVSFHFGDQTGTAAPGTRSEPSTTVCLPRDGHADIKLSA